MFSIPDFLGRAKAGLARKLGEKAVSDYRLAKHIEVTPQTVSGWLAGVRMPDDRAVIKLCELSGDDPVTVAVQLQGMRAANDEAAELWKQVAARLAVVAIVVLLGAALLDSSLVSPEVYAMAGSVHYVN